VTDDEIEALERMTNEYQGIPPKPARNGGAFQFMAVGDLEYRPPEFLVALLIETSVLALIFGDPGCGKSFIAIDIALCVATGTPFHGHAVKRGPVFYIAGEGFNGLARRFAAWGKARGVDIKGAPLFVSTRPAQFLDAGSAQAVAEAVRGLAAQHGAPALIVIDTLARNFGPGDENSTSEMGQFIAAIDDLKARFPGCAVLIVHHTGHGDKQRARGAMALKGALDCEYRLGKDGATVKLINTKMKDAEPPAMLAFTLNSVDLGNGASSAVLEQTDARPTEKPLTANQRLGQETFAEAAANSDCWADGEFTGLHRDQWREAFYAAHTGDSIRTRSTARTRQSCLRSFGKPRSCGAARNCPWMRRSSCMCARLRPMWWMRWKASRKSPKGLIWRLTRS
jgi:hypothetical protein